MNIPPKVVENTPQDFQLPWGVCSTTLGSIINYPGEYFPLPWGVCSTTLGSMFNYLGEHCQLPWGVFSTNLGSVFNYPGEYVSTLLGSKIANILIKTKTVQCCPEKSKKT